MSNKLYLGNNPKIEVTPEMTYLFKPPYKMVNKKELIKLLKRKDLNGEGGIMYDDVLESLPNAEKIVQLLTTNGKIIQVKGTNQSTNEITIRFFGGKI